jgi:hypothetical protein
MHEEEERGKKHHEFIRRAVRTEWDRNRQIDEAQRQREKESLYTSHLQEQRRRKLMTKKASVTTTVSTSPEKNGIAVFRDQPFRRVGNMPDQLNSSYSSSKRSDTSCGSVPLRQVEGLEKVEAMVSRAVSMNRAKISTIKEFPESQISSLLDDSFEDEDLEDISME